MSSQYLSHSRSCSKRLRLPPHVQARVRAAMDAQVVNEGRHQGGRAPLGYVVVDGGPHPNPRKAAEGFRLRVLALDVDAAPVVRRIYDEYLSGAGDRAIAAGLNRDGIACPSARRPDQNRHRLADGWQGSTVRAILENPRYMGYAVFGRWIKHEMLADPDDVSAGHVTRFRRSSADRIVRSRVPAHPEIVSVEEFTQAQLVRRSRGAGGMQGIAKLERARTAPKRTYMLRGRVRCELCTRKMQGGVVRDRVYYRCIARTLAPGASTLADHPKTVNLREDVLTPAVNAWIGRLFAPENRDETVRALVASQEGAGQASTSEEATRRRLKDATATLKSYHAAIRAGVDPAAMVEAINQAQADREAAQAELDHLVIPTVLGEAEVYAMVDSLGDVGAVLDRGHPDHLARLYEQLHVEISYSHADAPNKARARLRLANECVRGGT